MVYDIEIGTGRMMQGRVGNTVLVRMSDAGRK